MRPAAYWAVFAYLALWAICVPGCQHRYRRTENAYLAEAERIKWDATEEKHDEQQQQTEHDSQRRVTGKLRVTKPDGTKWDLDWVDEAVAKYTAHAESASDSRSHTAGEKQKAKEAGSNLNVEGDTKVSSFAWLWWALLAVGVGAVLYVPLKLWLKSRRPKWL